MFIGCSHGELVCREAEKIAKAFMEDWKPKHRVHLGDLWDFAALRGGAGAEEKAMGIRHDYNCGLELLDWFQPQQLTLGNHDHRVWRAAKETSQGVLAEFCCGFSQEIEEELRKRRIQWSPWGVEQGLAFPVGDIWLCHGYQSTVYPAKTVHDVYDDSMSAHVHKPTSYYARKRRGGQSHTTGTLAAIDKMTYADGYTAKTGWRNSFHFGLHNTKTGAWKCWDVTKEGSHWVGPHGVL